MGSGWLIFLKTSLPCMITYIDLWKNSFSVGNIITGKNPGTKLLFSWNYPLNEPHVLLLLCPFPQV
jgi:hypothetical protein